MNEKTFELLPEFETIKADIRSLVDVLLVLDPRKL